MFIGGSGAGGPHQGQTARKRRATLAPKGPFEGAARPPELGAKRRAACPGAQGRAPGHGGSTHPRGHRRKATPTRERGPKRRGGERRGSDAAARSPAGSGAERGTEPPKRERRVSPSARRRPRRWHRRRNEAETPGFAPAPRGLSRARTRARITFP
jgi:hypothetical protein